jgi:hypothetical protein
MAEVTSSSLVGSTPYFFRWAGKTTKARNGPLDPSTSIAIERFRPCLALSTGLLPTFSSADRVKSAMPLEEFTETSGLDPVKSASRKTLTMFSANVAFLRDRPPLHPL